MATVRDVFKGPGPKANGLQARPEGLWICDQGDDRMYLVDYADGAVITSFDTPGRNFSGCAFGAGGPWGAANVRPSTLYRFNPANGQCLQAIVLPEPMAGGVHGIEYAEDALWVTRPGLKIIQKLDPKTGELLHQIPFPATRSHGLYWEDGAIVCVETNNHVVYHLDPKDGRVLDEWRIDGFEPHGMTKDAAGRIWVCDAETNRIGIVER
jgi:streptogramin lyase